MLIAVLFSTQQLTHEISLALHQVAVELYERDLSVGPVAGDFLSGSVRNLKKDLLLGTIGGPAFEAEIETERGNGKVRFLLTRAGLEHLGKERAPAKPQYLH